MALKSFDLVRRGAWAFLALALLAPGIAPAQTCDPELEAVALVLEATPPSPSESHPCCAVQGVSVAAPQILRAGPCGAPPAAESDRVRFDIPLATRFGSPLHPARRSARYCARSARLLR